LRGRLSAVLVSVLLAALFLVMAHMMTSAAKPVQGSESPPASMAGHNQLDLHGCTVLSVGVSGPWAELLRSSGVEVVDLEAVTGESPPVAVEGFKVFMVNVSGPVSQSNSLVDVIGRKFLEKGRAVVFVSSTGLENDKLKSHLEAMLKDNSLALRNIASGLDGKTCVSVLEPDGSVRTRYCTSSKKVYVFSLRLAKVGDTGYAAPMVRVFSADPGAVVEEERLRSFLLETLSAVCGSMDG